MANIDPPLPAGEPTFQILFHHPLPMWVYDLETLAFVDVNAAALARYGYSREEFLSMTIKAIRPVEDVPRLLANVAQLRPALQHSGQWRHRLKDGSVIDVDITSHTVTYNGRPAALVMTHDITQQRQTEAALQRLNRTYAVLSGINQAIVRLRQPQALFEAACRIAVEEGSFRLAWIGLVNEASQRIEMAAQAGEAGDYLEKINVDLDDKARRAGPVGSAFLSGKHVVVNDTAQDSRMAPWRKDALRLGYGAVAAFPLKVRGTSRGTFTLYAREAGFFDVREVALLDDLAEDISLALELAEQTEEHRRAEAQLRLQSAALAAAVNAIVITDRAGIIQWVNPAFTRLTGYELAEARGCNPRDLVKSGQQDPAVYANLWQTIMAGQPWQGEMVNRRKDGSLYSEEQTITPLLDEAGQITHFIAIKQDVTARKQLEAENQQLLTQIYQTQKMESIGRLAGGIAHDFNNLLVPIVGYTELGIAKLDPGSDLRRDLERIKNAGERAAQLTRQILAFSRQQMLEITTLDLNEVISNFQHLLTRLIGEDIILETHLTSGLPTIRADRVQLEQVLLNLVVNARDAMPDGGRLLVETAPVTLGKTYTAHHAGVKPGPHVMLAISDTGQGMDAATQQHIFEPFFTTKSQGRGTGLGLATVFGIVKQHGGHIWVYSEPGRGTTFKIYLPLTTAPLSTAKVEPAEGGSLAGTETILLVEDEPGVRQLVRDTLLEHGYRVLEAGQPEQALALALAHTGPIHLLLTDVIMPHMNGRDLYQKVTANRAGLKVLYMSGYTDDIIAHHHVLDQDVAFLQKPFTVYSLLQKVRAVLT